jgi:hypothetical protein
MSVALAFNLDDAQRAADEWGCNCGPGALAAVTGLTLEAVRPHLVGFDEKRYTNPKMMAAALRSLKIPFQRVYECLGARNPEEWKLPRFFGLVRIQFAGPWTRPGVPVRARYRHTHWIGFWCGPAMSSWKAFDVNAIATGGWLDWDAWRFDLVPWLLSETEPQSTGVWWPTHSWEIPTRRHGE